MPQVCRPDIIDVEASGFGRGSYPIEVGFALADGTRYCALIRPLPGWDHWDPRAERVHGIDRQALLSAGREAGEVAAELNRLLAGRTLYSDGWVVDDPWLRNLFHSVRQPMLFRVSALEMILNEAQLTRWADARDAVVTRLGLDRHRASADALIIQETWVATRDDLALDDSAPAPGH